MYLVFAYNAYYPSGGWNDFKFSCDNEADLLNMILNRASMNGMVIDMIT